MNVAAHPFILSTQRLPAELRREPQPPSRPVAASQPLRDVREIASGRPIAAEPERREAFAERRTPRRSPDESPRSLSRRDAEDRGRLLDVYC